MTVTVIRTNYGFHYNQDVWGVGVNITKTCVNIATYNIKKDTKIL